MSNVYLLFINLQFQRSFLIFVKELTTSVTLQDLSTILPSMDQARQQDLLLNHLKDQVIEQTEIDQNTD